MSGADATWLHMDRPRNLMVVNTVLWFDGEPAWDQLERSFFDRVVDGFRVFRSKPVDPPVTLGLVMPRWEEVPVDPRDHVVRVRLPAPGDDAMLHGYIAREAAQALDHQCPLWQLHLIEGYGRGGAVLLRTHHAMGDGPAIMHVLERWAGVADDGAASPGANGGTWPGAEIATSLGAMKRDAGMLGKLFTGMPATATLLAEELNGVKAMAWTEPVPLARVKQLGADLHATVNDVGLALIAGALRRSVEAAATVPQVEAVVPVTIRPAGRPIDGDLGNRFGLVFVPLPLDAGALDERVPRVKAAMDEIKATREARTVFDALNAVGSAPRQGAQAWVDAFARRASAVITNIQGPRQPLAIGPHPIDGLMLWVPSTGPVGLGVSICSYAGTIRFGVIADTAVMPDPIRLTEALSAELSDASTA
jgi:WS/DGAT/MGAT family acyltransferase